MTLNFWRRATLSTVTMPSSMRRWTCPRDNSGTWVAMNLSRRRFFSPAVGCSSTSVCSPCSSVSSSANSNSCQSLVTPSPLVMMSPRWNASADVQPTPRAPTSMRYRRDWNEARDRQRWNPSRIHPEDDRWDCPGRRRASHQIRLAAATTHRERR